MLVWISGICLVIAVVSFGAFIYFLLKTPRAAGGGNVIQTQSELEGVAKVAEALAKLVESFNKAGPVALTLTSAIIFMVMALIAAKS